MVRRLQGGKTSLLEKWKNLVCWSWVLKSEITIRLPFFFFFLFLNPFGDPLFLSSSLFLKNIYGSGLSLVGLGNDLNFPLSNKMLVVLSGSVVQNQCSPISLSWLNKIGSLTLFPPKKKRKKKSGCRCWFGVSAGAEKSMLQLLHLLSRITEIILLCIDNNIQKPLHTKSHCCLKTIYPIYLRLTHIGFDTLFPWADCLLTCIP